MLGLIATLSMQFAATGSVIAEPGDSFLYTNNLGVRVEVAGVCSIDECSIVAWNTSGKPDEKLRQEVASYASESGGRRFDYSYGQKTRYAVLRVSGPRDLKFSLTEVNAGGVRTVHSYRFSQSMTMHVLPIYGPKSATSASIRVDVPADKTVLGSLEPKNGQKAGQVTLKRVTRFVNGMFSRNTNVPLMAESQLLTFNSNAWVFLFDTPTIQPNETIQFSFVCKDIESPLRVDYDGKPTDSKPLGREQMLDLYRRSAEPNPKTYVVAAQSYVIVQANGGRAVATNINPKYINKVTVYKTVNSSAVFRNIPLDPSKN